MARKFLKDSEGLQLITSTHNKSRAFQVAETISLDLGIKAVVTNVKDPETGGKGLGIYVISSDGEIPPKMLEEAIKLWNEYI